jgi:hypothetical protein
VAAGLALAVGLLVTGSATLPAQTTTASVLGAAEDSQGGRLPGVTVTLTSHTRGDTYTATTDAQGDYVFPYVRPDTYTLKLSLTGFKTVEKARLVVNANDKFSAGTATMEVGNVEESVTVLSRVTELQAKSGERSYTLEGPAIENIAVNGRSFFGLATLAPGVLPNATVFGDSPPPTAASGFTANGQRPNSNNVTIDGITNLDTGDNGGNMATTNLEAVAEFKVLTSAYQAEFGRAVGAQVSVVTRSGARDFAGSAYWYGRRSDWDANTWINNRAGTPKPDTSRNDFGYTLGGPIYLSGRFNEDKSRLFFFWSQEFQRRRDPLTEFRVTVPTAKERQGDFAESVDANGDPYPYIRDYVTGLPCSAADSRGCFRDGGVLGRIPQDRLYPHTLALLDTFPEPNVEGQKGYNYSSQEPLSWPRREELLRIDFHPSDRWRLAARYMHSKDDRESPYGTGPAGMVSNVPNMDGHYDVPAYTWMVSANGILDSTTSLEVALGGAHNSIDAYTTNENLTRTASGLADLPMLYPEAVQGDMPPTVTFGGGRVGNPAARRSEAAPFTNFNTTYDVIANLTKVAGPHVLKAGFFFQRSRKDQATFAPFNGVADFSNNINNPIDSGHPFANAALGVYNTFRQASKYAMPSWRYKNFEWYLQDNWKASQRLTLDYGSRFYVVTPQWDVTRQASNFLPEAYDPAQAVRLYTPALAAGRRVAYDAATGSVLPAAFIGRVVPESGDPYNGTFQAGKDIEDTLTTGSAFRVSPRFGFAYDVTGKQSVVVRGGFGVFYDRPMGNLVFGLINNPPGVAVQQLTWGRFQDIDPKKSAPLNAPIALYPTQHEWDLPKVYGWNVGLQARLPLALVLDVAYVGTDSRKQAQAIPINAVPYGAAYLPENQDPTLPKNPTPGATALPVDFLRPYRGYGEIRMYEFSAFSNYHALQAGVTRRFDRGLMFGATYSWSKALGVVNDDYSFGRPDGPEGNRRANYSYVSSDRPHNFVVNFVYQSPRVADGFLGVLANGWQLSGIYRWASGTPYPITFSIPGYGAINLTGSDQNARVVVTGDSGKGWSDDPYRQIDTNVFAPPQPHSLGFESARYFLHGPPIDNLDLSASKSFSLGGKRRLEIRLDAFNALNHTQFAAVNSQVNFKSLDDPTVTNLPFDAAGNLVNPTGFGTVSSVRAARQLQLMARFEF